MVKTEIKVIGITHVVGAKDNKTWDYYKMHFAYGAQNTEGCAVASALIEDGDRQVVVIGNTYPVVLNFNKGYASVIFL